MTVDSVQVCLAKDYDYISVSSGLYLGTKGPLEFGFQPKLTLDGPLIDLGRDDDITRCAA
jgi:hypothetical protein